MALSLKASPEAKQGANIKLEENKALNEESAAVGLFGCIQRHFEHSAWTSLTGSNKNTYCVH